MVCVLTFRRAGLFAREARAASGGKPTIGQTAPAHDEPAHESCYDRRMAAKRKSVTEATVRRLALALPDATEGTSYGTPGFYRKKKLFARLHQDGESLVLKVDFDTRDGLLEAAPDVFFVTAHYDGYPAVLLRMAKASEVLVKHVLADAWAFAAPKKR
jgi:hypothetical protein